MSVLSEPCKPGQFRVREIGEITCSDGEKIRGAIIEFPEGLPAGMTWDDVWTGRAFEVARPAKHEG